MAQAPDGPGIDVHIRVDRMSEDYIRGAAPLSFAVSRLRLTYQLSANGSGILATQRISNPSESIDQPFTPGREPRGFSLALGKNGQPQLRVWAAGLQREVIVPARFVRGDWAALTAGAPVVLAAPVEDLQRAHGVADQLGKVVTRALRQRLENAIPFVTIRIGDMVLQDISLSRRDAIIEGSSRGLAVTYPAAEISYGAPVTVGY
jgi:hypothetical protein